MFLEIVEKALTAACFGFFAKYVPFGSASSILYIKCLLPSGRTFGTLTVFSFLALGSPVGSPPVAFTFLVLSFGVSVGASVVEAIAEAVLALGFLAFVSSTLGSSTLGALLLPDFLVGVSTLGSTLGSTLASTLGSSLVLVL